MKTRYYYKGKFYRHISQLWQAYRKDKGCYPLRFERTTDTKGNPILVYK